ncbi:MAG: LytTR family DNA-binding domain-containing protein [Saprospiraceae bacterium]|nr:LytTR family DNA-binding domain-containing protein [Saprospiraceae bacterium]
MIRTIIIDDEPLARDLLSQYIGKVSYLDLIHTFSDPLKGLEYINANDVDLMFLDIEMPNLSGIGLLKILQKKTDVILTTAFSEYALDGYDLSVVDYLLKPITFERFLQAVEKAKIKIEAYASAGDIHRKSGNAADGDFIFIKDGTKLVRINLHNIQYIEGLKDYVSIYTPDQKIVSLQRMKNLEQQLPKSQFIRIHHSYIISIKWIHAIHKDYVEINKASIPIGETYRKAFREFIDQQKFLGE